MDKGLATNPALGTGLVAGFRTSGNSERPGFAWFFGRDALWTSLALTASGGIDTARTALAFLAKYQREDGKIPHEISQSAALVPWFSEFPYAMGERRCDASLRHRPRRSLAHRGDRAYLEQYWPSIVKAYAFSTATDADGNGLIDNTGVGHGWVEGGALSPPHEEIYLQGLWIEASRSFAEMAVEMRDEPAAARARAAAERTRTAVESTYWLADGSYYAFATSRPRTAPPVAEPGPERERRQRRLNALAECDARRRRHRAARGPDVVAHARSRARRRRARSPRERRDGHRLGPPHPVRTERAVRSAVVSLRIGLAALHRLGVDGGVPLRPSARRLPGADGERAAHRIRARSGT